MALSFVQSLNNARALAIKASIEAGASVGKLKIYAGSVPTNARTALGAQTLLATIPLANPCAPDPTVDVLAFTMPQEADAIASAVATFFRITDSNDVVCVQGTVAEGSGGDLNLVETTLVSGLPVRISSFSVSEPV